MMTRHHRSAKLWQWHRHRRVWLATWCGMVIFGGAIAVAQTDTRAVALPDTTAQEVQIPTIRTLEIGLNYGKYSGNVSHADAQFLTLWFTKPADYVWRFDVSRVYRFSEAGLAFGVANTQFLSRGFNLTLGFSSGTSKTLTPKYRFDIGLQKGLLSRGQLVVALGYTRNQSWAENGSDGFTGGLTFYASPHWIFNGSVRHDIGYPGNTQSTLWGLGVTLQDYQRSSVTASCQFGSVAYQLITPDISLVDYDTIVYTILMSTYFTSDSGLNFRFDYEHNDTYDFGGFALSYFTNF